MSASKPEMMLAILLLLGTLGHAAERPPAATDRYGDPLPAGAVARLGTIRFHQDAWDYNLLFMPDGKSLISTGQGPNRIVFWETATGRRLRAFGGRGDSTALALSPHGKWLAFADRTVIHLWDVAGGKELHTIALEGVSSLAFSPDGKTLASGSVSLHLWDVARGKELWRNRDHKEAVHTVLFAPDGKVLISGSGDDSIRFWNPADHKEIRKIQLDQFGSRTLALSPDGKLLAAGGQEFFAGKVESQVRLFDTTSGKEVRILSGQKYGVNSLAFSPHGKLLVSSGCEEIRLWDVATGRLVHRIGGREGMAGRPVFSPDGKTLATRSLSMIRFLDVATGKPLHDWPGHDEGVCTLTFSRDGKRLISGGGDIRIWATDTGEQQRVFPGHYLPSLGTQVRAVALTPDGREVISSGPERTLRRRALATGQETCQFHITDSNKDKDRQQVLVMNLSTDGKTLAAVSTGFNGPERGDPLLLTLWDTASGKRLARYRLPSESHVGWGLFLPDNRAVISALGDKLVLRDPEKGRQLFAFTAHARSFPTEWAISFDGKLLATRTYTLAPPKEPGKKQRREVTETRVQLWELDTGIELLSIPTKSRGHFLAFSPNGALLAGYEENEMIAVWDTFSGAKLRSFRDPDLRLRSLAFSPGGKRLASGLTDGTILVWDTGAIRDGHRNDKEDQKDLETLWNALADTDGPKAHAAMGQLVAMPERTVPLLAKRLQPVAAIPEERLQRWITELDSADFQARETATRELGRRSEQVEPALRLALSKHPAAETRKRIEHLLSASRPAPSGAELQRLRAIRVLERIGSPEARRVLSTLKTGAPLARATADARAALERLRIAGTVP